MKAQIIPCHYDPEKRSIDKSCTRIIDGGETLHDVHGASAHFDARMAAEAAERMENASENINNRMATARF